VDRQRVGAFGHSRGGVTAGQFCVEDTRCRAALNLDGIPQYGAMIDSRMEKPLLMVYSARAGRAGASDAIYQRSASAYYRVDVRDTLHLDFSDMPFWGGPLAARGAFGAMPPARSTAITRRIVREFFDQELRGRRSPLLAGEPVFTEVTARRVR
jgi:predicted dienelactone hydrolase